MNSASIWIFLPAVTGLGLYFFRRWFKTTVTIGVMVSASLAVLAWFLPVGELVNLGALSFKVGDSFEILGRRLVLEDQDRLFIWMTFAMSAFWFAAVYITRAGRATVPLGLLMVAFWMAAMAVEPLLFAALLMEIAVLVSIPIFIQPGLPGIVLDQKLVSGGVRLLVMQTLGMAFLLMTGWALSGVETMPNREAVIRTTSLLAFGLALILGIYPFHTWILVLSQRSHPYAAAFGLVALPWMGLNLGLRFLDRYTWLNQVEVIVYALQAAGALMLLAGGVGAAFERHLGRILGYAILLETGYGLLAISSVQSLPLLMAAFLPKMVSFGVLALAMSVMQSRLPDLSLPSLKGVGIRLPFVSTALVLALLSITGVPLLAFFPLRLALLESLVSQAAWAVGFSLVGCLGLLAATMRVALSLVSSETQFSAGIQENWQVLSLTGMAILFLILVGLFPHWFSLVFSQSLRFFENLAP
jgi:formate hydrogenlyase subunit 3/multisubunit Na+/H+ antiporter MnhD subunit